MDKTRLVLWEIEDEAGSTSIYARNLPEALRKFEEQLADYPGCFEALDFLSIKKHPEGLTWLGKFIEGSIEVEEQRKEKNEAVSLLPEEGITC